MRSDRMPVQVQTWDVQKQAVGQSWSLGQYLTYWTAHGRQATEGAGQQQPPAPVDEADSRVQQRWGPSTATLCAVRGLVRGRSPRS